MVDGFLGRWSQRKQALREGRAIDEPAEPARVNEPLPLKPVLQEASRVADVQVAEPLPVPTLEDVKALNADSSFAPFVSRDVTPEVRNAAMKKLFTDPHYNVMDRLDIYIDDYSVADPIPATMLRQMASAKFLNLFDEESPPGEAHPAQSVLVREDANTVSEGSVAQSVLTPSEPDSRNASPPDTSPTAAFAVGSPLEYTDHDHTDLRLQPDDAARSASPGRVPE